MISSTGDDWMFYLASDYQTITDRLVVSDVLSPDDQLLWRWLDVLSGFHATGDVSQVLSFSDMSRINNDHGSMPFTSNYIYKLKKLKLTGEEPSLSP